MADRYMARSASDRTDDWPFWFVADGGPSGLNVTIELLERVGIDARGHLPFLTEPYAKHLADFANRKGL